MALAFVVVGVLLLGLGSEGLLRGGIGLSKTIGLPPILIGLIVVTLATCAPELSVALQTVRHTPDITITDVIGSNIINLLLVMGLGALFTQLPTPPKTVFRDGIAAILACAALAFFAFDGKITKIEGLILLAGFLVYAVIAIVTDWSRAAQDSEARAQCRGANDTLAMSSFITFLGVVGIVLGGRCLIDGALTMAGHYHINNAMIGLTIIAAATAIPEIIVMATMAARGWSFVTAGHLLTACIFNILVVLGLTAALHPFAISPAAQAPDVYVMLGAAVVIFPLMVHAWRLSRPNGFLLVVLYIAYAAFLAQRMGYLPPLPHLG
jgi:cation:H+ antiporter